MGRTQLFALSFGAHALVGAILGGLPQKVRREIIAISMTDTKKPAAPEPPPPPPPPEPEPVVTPKVQPVKAKTAPPKAGPAEAPPPEAPAPAAAEAPPDFGLSLSNGAGAVTGGLAVAAGTPSGTGSGGNHGGARTLTRTLAPAADDCTEAPTKPKALSRPMPVYPEAAKAAAIVGKVRVEITVDAKGNVASVRVLEGLGHGLDEACVAAAKAMTFEPGQRCGKPATSILKVGFAF